MNIYIVHTENGCSEMSDNIDSIWSSKEKAEIRFTELLQDPNYVSAYIDDIDDIDDDKMILFIDVYEVQ